MDIKDLHQTKTDYQESGRYQIMLELPDKHENLHGGMGPEPLVKEEIGKEQLVVDLKTIRI